MRFVGIALLTVASVALADPAKAPSQISAGAEPDDPAATALLTKIAGDATARKQAIDDLSKLAPKVVDGLGQFLARKHDTDAATRRKVLEAIKAQVPDKNGHFTVPERKSAKEEQADDNLDWLAGLEGLDASTPGIGEVIADDVAIRALASTKNIHAAQLMFDTAFGDDTII
ncbi:MAG TPA: hypothetical protein VGG28_14610, partial [Kofleriaceae bacterium]